METSTPERLLKPMVRPSIVIVLAMLLFLLSTGGFYGAYMLLTDVSGLKLGTPLSMLEHLPLTDFLVPGIVLLIFMGILPFVTAVGVLRKDLIPGFQRFTLLKKYSWAYAYAVFVGFFLIAWTIGELILWGINGLSVTYFIWGLLILLLCIVPKTRKYYLLIPA